MSYSAPVVVEPPPPPPPAISIGDAMIAEGGQLQFTLTLDTASANPVTVALWHGRWRRLHRRRHHPHLCAR